MWSKARIKIYRLFTLKQILHRRESLVNFVNFYSLNSSLRVERQFLLGSFMYFKRMCSQVQQFGVVDSPVSNTLQLEHGFSSCLCKDWRPWPWAGCEAVFPPAEQWLTLRKVSRDPFSMNSVMIITGLPRETQNKAAVSEAGLQGRKAETKKRWGTEEWSPQLWPAFLAVSLGDSVACRHQSHWQLLISPLHKRQEIIRMDQSTRICVCVRGLLRSHEC